MVQDLPGVDFELLQIHVTPTKPGHSRIIVHFYMGGSNVPLSLKVFPKLQPAWHAHLMGLEITDGDNTFLIAQVRPMRHSSLRAVPKLQSAYIWAPSFHKVA